MEFFTTRFGELSVSEDKVINFPEGFIGLSAHDKFVIVADESISPFIWFQSLVKSETAFLVIDPFLIMPEYEPLVSDEDLNTLGFKSKKEAQMYVVAIVSKDFREMTANFMAPILVNMQLRKGLQTVLFNADEYSARYDVLDRVDRLMEENFVTSKESVL